LKFKKKNASLWSLITAPILFIYNLDLLLYVNPVDEERSCKYIFMYFLSSFFQILLIEFGDEERRYMNIDYEVHH
jgi:hypothetical protein